MGNRAINTSGNLSSTGSTATSSDPAPWPQTRSVSSDPSDTVTDLSTGQWIIPDGRLINRPNPTLWEIYSSEQVYMTALQAHAISAGPAVTFSASIPDVHHYNGRGGRVFPLWADRQRDTSNVKDGLLEEMASTLGARVNECDLMAYLAGVAAHPAYTARFQTDLVKPGLRFPLTADPSLFAEAVEIGREIVWLHCFGERFVDPGAGRLNAAPRMREGERPHHPEERRHPDSCGQLPEPHRV